MEKLTAMQRKAISNAKNEIIAKKLKVTVKQVEDAKADANKAVQPLVDKYVNMNKKKAEAKKKEAKKAHAKPKKNPSKPKK